MDSAMLTAMVMGSLRDPILWILSAAIGWKPERPVRITVAMLAAAGSLWGAMRVAIYAARGEPLVMIQMVTIVAVCIALMTVTGLAVREVRRIVAQRR